MSRPSEHLGESRTTRDYSFGEFLRVWGQSFDSTQALGHPVVSGHQVWMVVDGAERAPTDALVLRDGMSVSILCDVR